MSEIDENALLLIASVRAALKNGVKHFAGDGRPLLTENDVLTELRNNLSIQLDENERVQVTTDAEELAMIKATMEFADKINTYHPTEKDKKWTEDLIAMVADGALWGTTYGSYHFDKVNKVLTLKAVFDADERDNIHVPIAAVFASIGWTVNEEI